ncbi:MAG: hypothetical protein E6Q24_05400 [Chitinophagaceae bacterium]|nr:MAG: hypothetical protein E6Q24_05400 [Chitinophagaceae bacterium]
MDIVSKFTVASEQGINDLFFLKEAKYKGMYRGIVQADKLDHYISQQLDYVNAVNELNALGNQMIILYVRNEPAGFAIIKKTGTYPDVLRGKRILNYSFFYIHPGYDDPETRASLWQKCLSVSKMQDAVWVELLQNDPLVPFLESCGFIIHERAAIAPFDQPSYILIRYKEVIYG